ncbi:hypothetical protein ACGFXC_37375 [Streptomyces sp. NPDC048507]|uniref:hypothetical protein n=1 Tax=Streptomyces sp. NPDC048507 TaxID=3365560 RepID=UPI003720061C
MTTTDDTGRDWLEEVLAGEWDEDGPQTAAAVPVQAAPAPVLTERQARERDRQAEWEARNRPNPVAEDARRRMREAAEARRRAAAEAAEAEARKQAEAEAAAEADEDLDGEPDSGDDVEAGAEAEAGADSGRQRWWSLKPERAESDGPGGPDADGAEGGAAPAAPAAASAPKPGAARSAASRWGWLAYHGSAAAVGHGALWGLTGNQMGGAAWLDSAMVSVLPVTTAAVACCAGWAGWRLGRALRPYLPYGALAAPAGLIAGLAWGQGSTGLVAEVFAWAAPWPALAAPAVMAALAGTGCWAALDRRARARNWAPPLRWAAHIPLATVALSAALYAPGALL